MFNLGFQGSVTPIMEGIIDLHNHIFFFLVLIFVFVFWLFSNILYRFWWQIRSPAARVSLGSLRHLSHNTLLEVVWTIFPSFILVAIAVPSFALLYAMDEVLEPTLTLKAVGHQWYWSYQYSNCLPSSVSADLHPDLLPKSLWDSLYLEANLLGKAVIDLPGYPRVDVGIANSRLKLSSVGLEAPRLLPFSKEEVGYARRALKLPPGTTFDNVSPAIIDPWISTRLRARILHYLTNNPIDLAKGVSPVPTVGFDSYMLAEDDLQLGDYRLLEVDEPVVLPAHTHIRLLITGEDVIHSFALPQMGVKVDAIPGRLNQQGIFIKRLGTFYGQCSEICGVNHGFMPIVVHAVPIHDFMEWYVSKLQAQEPSMDLKMANPEEVFYEMSVRKYYYDRRLDHPLVRAKR